MLTIGLAMLFMLSLFSVMYAACRPAIVLYALAAVVSIVGINIHFGVTLYLSRVVIIFFLVSILVRAALDRQTRLPYKLLLPFVSLFGLILLTQLISALLSARVLEGLREIFIYVSLMVLFVVVIAVGTKVEILTKAIRIYLVIGLVQGLYGMYQVVGGPFNLPTYQTFMVGIPTANDRTFEGFYYSGTLQTFRAVGFFSSDVSHYAGYLVGVLILAIVVLISNRRTVLPYAVLIVAGLGLLFSLSRSGILSFIVFGIPSLLFLLWRVHASAQRNYRAVAMFCLQLAGVVAVAMPLIISTLDIDLTSSLEILSSRLTDLVDAGTDEKGSMKGHLQTRMIGLDALATNPLIGVGLGVNASPWYSEYYRDGWAGSHSHHINMLGQTGLLGAVLEWLLMWLVARYMWSGLFVRRDSSPERNLLAGLLAAFITIVLGNFLYFYYLNDFVWFLMGSGVALSRLLIMDATNRVAIVLPELAVDSAGRIIGAHQHEQSESAMASLR